MSAAKTDDKALDHLADAMVEDMFTTPDDEFRAEIANVGINPAEEIAMFDALFHSAASELEPPRKAAAGPAESGMFENAAASGDRKRAPERPQGPAPKAPGKVRREGYFARGLRFVEDGTFREVRDSLKPAHHEIEALLHDENGFVALKNESFNTRKIDDYAAIMKDPELWAVFENQNMNRYFGDPIILFPYDRAAIRQNANKADVGAFIAPGRFFQVQQDMVERRFPLGRERTPGDADLRDAISALRRLFARNFWSLIWRRRLLMFRSIVWGILAVSLQFATIAALAKFGKGGISADISIALVVGVGVAAIAYFGVAYVVVLEFIKNMKEQFFLAVRSSCLLLGRNLQVRQQDIIATIPLIFREADNEKFDFMGGDTELHNWPEQVRKWTKLAFWMAGRVEYNDLFMQLEMWRIRRLHFGMKWFATALSNVIAVFGIAAFAVLAAALSAYLLLGTSDWSMNSWLGQISLASAALVTAAAMIYVITLAFVTDRRHLVDLDFIENSILTNNIQGHKDVKLHDIVAAQLARATSALLYEEDKKKI